MSDYLDLDLIENPYGKRIGGGYSTVLTGAGDRSHIQGPDGGPLCMQGRPTHNLRASKSRVVTCYRCIKIMGIESNAPYLRRELTTARGVKKAHLMMPGGREGELIGDVTLGSRSKRAGKSLRSPFGMQGAQPFKRGPTNHPTQGQMTKRLAMAKTYEERLVDEGIALPVAYSPFAAAAEPDIDRYESPGAKRRRVVAERKARIAAAAAQKANPPATLRWTRTDEGQEAQNRGFEYFIVRASPRSWGLYITRAGEAVHTRAFESLAEATTYAARHTSKVGSQMEMHGRQRVANPKGTIKHLARQYVRGQPVPVLEEEADRELEAEIRRVEAARRERIYRDKKAKRSRENPQLRKYDSVSVNGQRGGPMGVYLGPGSPGRVLVWTGTRLEDLPASKVVPHIVADSPTYHRLMESLPAVYTRRNQRELMMQHAHKLGYGRR